MAHRYIIGCCRWLQEEAELNKSAEGWRKYVKKGCYISYFILLFW